MSDTSEVDLRAVSQTFAEVAQKLQQLAEQMEHASPEERAALQSTLAQTLAQTQTLLAGQSRAAAEPPSKPTTTEITDEALQEQVLRELARGGPALPLELAAALLVSPRRLNGVLNAMQRLGLIEMRAERGGTLIRLTPEGIAAAKRLLGR